MTGRRERRIRLERFFSWPTNGWLARPWFMWPATGSDRYSLMRILRYAIHEKCPVAPMIEAFALDEKPSQRWRLRRLLAKLQDGVSIPDALEATPGLLPRGDVAKVRASYQLGLASPELVLGDDLVGLQTSTAADPHAMVWRIVWYVVMTLGTAIVVSVYLYADHLDTFEQILQDLNVSAPNALRSFRWLGEQAGSWAWILALAILMVVMLGWSKRVRAAVTRQSWIARLLSTRDWHAAELLETMADAAEAGRPFVATISTLARTYHDPPTRHQLLVVRNELDHGSDAWETLQHAKILGTADVRVIRLADSTGELPWTLRTLASARRSQTTKRMNLLLQIGQWMVVLVLGLCVLSLGMVLFEFLCTALTTLTEAP